MKFYSSILLGALSVSAAEWIQPPERSSKGYLVPVPDYNPLFPRDHGAHIGYGLEWWYWVGHLETEDGSKEYGFQSTVFRVAGKPTETNEQAKSTPFGNQQLFLAHAALSDQKNQSYLHTERVFREGWQAFASRESLDFKVGGIEANMKENREEIQLTTRYPDGGKLELSLIPVKPLVQFGDRGLSRKGDGAASVSWYWSYTRLQAQGTLHYKDKKQEVKGIAWMDHEISSSQLGEGLAGWDWTCMQLEDGSEVKAYRLRKDDGTSDRWSAVYWIDPKGEIDQVYADQFSWEEEGEWTSPVTKLSYPIRVRITANHPQKGKQIYRLRPLLENQEFYGNRADNAYWEGACEVMDPEEQIIGRAYLELAGYGGGLGARLN